MSSLYIDRDLALTRRATLTKRFSAALDLVMFIFWPCVPSLLSSSFPYSCKDPCTWPFIAYWIELPYIRRRIHLLEILRDMCFYIADPGSEGRKILLAVLQSIPNSIPGPFDDQAESIW